MLHTISFTRMERLRNQYLLHFDALKTILPCPQCRRHYGEYMEDSPVSTSELVDWVASLHNFVAERKGAPVWSREQLMEKYFRDGSLVISHPVLFRWMDIVVGSCDDETRNIDTFQDYIIFFSTLEHIFPCSYCRDKYVEILQQYPLSAVYDPISLRLWWHQVEDAWKKKLGEHYYAGHQVFILYNRGKQWFKRNIRMESVRSLEIEGRTVKITMQSGKEEIMTLPADIDRAKVVTDCDINYAKKIIALYS